MAPLYVLIHSPLVGPLTWSLVASEMQGRGLEVLVPELKDSPHSSHPLWKQHADSVAQALGGSSRETPVILVAHSGTGPLLPSIRQAIPNPVEAYMFVDAGLPSNGATRLDLMNAEDPAWGAQFARHLKKGGLFPDWSFDDLQVIIPDPRLRRQMVAEIRPRGESFFTEPIPVFSGWPDASCVYILFSPPYKQAEMQARQMGWITNSIEAGHFHMLVAPGAVADAMIRAVNKAAQS